MWFIADVLINLRTGYMVEGHFVSDDILAIKHYLRGSFLIDVIGSFPLNYVLLAATINSNSDDITTTSIDAARSNKLIRLVRLTKLTKLFRMIKFAAYLEYVEHVVKFNPGLLRVFRLVMISLLCCHWFGCVWWLIAYLERSYEELMPPNPANGTPMPPNEWHPPDWLLHSEDLALKYWVAFCWGAGIALSMVPRDIEPMTTLEAIATTAMMFIGLMIAAFVISSFTSAFASMDSKNAIAGKQLDIIRNYLLLKAVPNDLRSRILEYYQYMYTSSQSMDDLKMLHHMPPNLSTQLALSINAKLISRSPIFQDVSNASLAALVSTLTPLVFVPGQLLCTEGQQLRMIFFINRGKVQLLQRAGSENEVLVRTLSENDNLGLDDYAASTQRIVSLSARSLTYCDVMSLSPGELSAALEHDSAERVRLEAERQRLETERKEVEGKANAPATDGKEHLRSCLRKAGMIAKMSRKFTQKDLVSPVLPAANAPGAVDKADTEALPPQQADVQLAAIEDGDAAGTP